jgi:hypothetical protein
MAITDISGKQRVYPTNLDYHEKPAFIKSHDDAGILNTHNFDLDDIGILNPNNNKSVHAEGYNWAYDLASRAICNLQTLRFPFQYKGTEYLIQFWKGHYFGIIHGSEIGIYKKSGNPLLSWLGQYDCAIDDRLVMRSTSYHRDTLWYETKAERVWWLGRGRIHDLSVNWGPQEMKLEGAIQFEDKTMFDAFIASVKNSAPKEFSFKTEGLTFSFVWLNTK